MTLVRPGRLGRRRVLSLAVALGVLPLVSCEDVAVRPSNAPGEPDADPDEALLEAAVRLEAEMVGALQPLLRAPAAPVRRLAQQTTRAHQAHLDLLGGAGEQVSPPQGTMASPQQVSTAQEGLSRRHAELAVRAESGPFARVLAGMSASSAQQADLWRAAAGRSAS